MPGIFTFWNVLGLALILGISVLVFWTHVHRWMRRPQWSALLEWAARNQFSLRRAGGEAPPPLSNISVPAPRVCMALVGRHTMFLQIQTPPAGDAPPSRWNALIHEIDVDWPPTALRPFGHATSLVDFFKLGSFPALLASDRLTLHGVDAPAARILAISMIRALLPPDVGLILVGRRMLVDFSGRPFDGIELSRILALGEQLAAHLPASTTMEEAVEE